ncbi:unnamed protein product [Calypogeia fissa]
MEVIKIGKLSQYVSMEVLKNKGTATGACIFIGLGYVALLYAPALFLPQPKSAQEHMLRRFACSLVASVLAPFICLTILPVDVQWDSDYVTLLKMFGLSTSHMWQVAVMSILLTATLYLGPLVLDLLDFVSWCIDDITISGQPSLLIEHLWSAMVYHGKMLASDVFWWRTFLVAPLSEELVFRVCMVPVLLCGGFSPSAVVFICPMFFALAHIHHFWDLVHKQRHAISKAACIVGLQLGYTTIFGWYATFLYLRTGNLIAPLVAHMFCNTMGLPDIGAAISSAHHRSVIMAYFAGVVGFFALLGPVTDLSFYNENPITEDCSCWLGYCKWRSLGKTGMSV